MGRSCFFPQTYRLKVTCAITVTAVIRNRTNVGGVFSYWVRFILENLIWHFQNIVCSGCGFFWLFFYFGPVSGHLLRRNPTEFYFFTLNSCLSIYQDALYFVWYHALLLARARSQCSCSVKTQTWNLDRNEKLCLICWSDKYLKRQSSDAMWKNWWLFCLLELCFFFHAITIFYPGGFQISFPSFKRFDKCEPVCFFMNVFTVQYGIES